MVVGNQHLNSCSKELVMKFIGSLVAILVIGGFVAGTYAGEKADRPLDKDFLIKVATCNQAGIEVSGLANKRSESSQVKDFATMVCKDHKASGDQLAELLKGRKLAIAAGFDKETKEEVKRLGKLEGNEFDRAYLHCMVKGHKEAIAIFENEAKNGKDDDIRTYAKDVLPHLRKHFAKAEELCKTVEK
jgi:putative membrane protein